MAALCDENKALTCLFCAFQILCYTIVVHVSYIGAYVVPYNAAHTLFMKRSTLPAEKGWVFFNLLHCGFSFLCFFGLCFHSSGRHSLSCRCQAQWGTHTQQESTTPHSPQRAHTFALQSHPSSLTNSAIQHSAASPPGSSMLTYSVVSGSRHVPGYKQKNVINTPELYLNQCDMALKEGTVCHLGK